MTTVALASPDALGSSSPENSRKPEKHAAENRLAAPLHTLIFGGRSGSQDFLERAQFCRRLEGSGPSVQLRDFGDWGLSGPFWSFTILLEHLPKALMPKKKKAVVRDGGGVLGRLGTDGRGGTEEFCPEFGSGWKRLGTKRSKGDKCSICDQCWP